MVGRDQRTATEETNEKGETGEWGMPEHPIKAAPRQQCVDWNEYGQREHEPSGDVWDKYAQEIKLGLHAIFRPGASARA